jgi:hypothetical protein
MHQPIYRANDHNHFITHMYMRIALSSLQPDTALLEGNNMENRIKTTTPESRGSSLQKLLSQKQGIRVIEAHSPLSAILVENASYIDGCTRGVQKLYQFKNSKLPMATH